MNKSLKAPKYGENGKSRQSTVEGRFLVIFSYF